MTGADARWRKSSRSGGSNQCVECAVVSGGRAVRDSKAPTAGTLVVPVAAFARLVETVKAGVRDV
ncbi:DUF397 domain-containing protein [Saccharothrix yanglingensis]|uniref:DUF397 domain-containing protein n=1 Tax=Saccharothrix yanglingensis TaxID=659496 RepID=A0ABU0WSQ3_9PSEU|nr:DUF397 domain-containing protein [Saccharothrix yanglingensis]MDQ2582864.1 DUF397 domain-containing protein [Saccharothrix yanglingensis]